MPTFLRATLEHFALLFCISQPWSRPEFFNLWPTHIRIILWENARNAASESLAETFQIRMSVGRPWELEF